MNFTKTVAYIVPICLLNFNFLSAEMQWNRTNAAELKIISEEIHIVEGLGKRKIEPTNPYSVLVVKGDKDQNCSFGGKNGQFILEGKEVAFFENPLLKNMDNLPQIKPWSIEIRGDSIVFINCKIGVNPNLNMIIIYGDRSK